ncbi:putative methyltransferase DDB_G0268948 isoform X2 [Anguilla anguilla]|nr:putative methyltransferase DDB_G0268948 isoform X2 [Anguilla anguilla]
MAHRLFEDKEHASAYQKYRISPSETLMGKVVDFLEKKKGKPFDLAVDVGCGSGQGTVLLAPHFKQVIGTDISPAQLEMARACSSAPNVSYRESAAEDLPFADGAADLVTAVTAAHWFDVPRFLREADRLLAPRGCLALLSYTMDMELQYGEEDCSRRLNQVCRELYAALWTYRNPHLEADSVAQYKKIFDSIPYPEKEWNDCVWERKKITLGHYIGMVQSFSNYQTMLKKDPEKARRLSQDFTDKFLAVMGASSVETEVVLGVRYFYVLARKP